MSLFISKKINQNSQLGIWQMTESVEELMEMKSFSSKDLSVLSSLSYEQRKKEWLVSRILAEQLTGENNIQIIYDENNKPFIKASQIHISLSHSHDLLAVIINNNKTGIDIELIKPTILRIKEKFMTDGELKQLGTESREEKLTLYWCVKESLYKYYGKKKLAFKKNLFVEQFSYKESGKLNASIQHESMNRRFELHYEKIHSGEKYYMLAYIVDED